MKEENQELVFWLTDEDGLETQSNRRKKWQENWNEVMPDGDFIMHKRAEISFL